MATFTKRIDLGIRDLWDWNDGSWHVDTSLERMGNLSGIISGLSLRFTDITISPGSTINSAKITFRSINTKTNTNLSLIIHGVAEDNTGEFTTSPIDDARTRTQTTASVTWSGAISWTSGSDYDTPDFTSIIQEIIDRGGWSSGNAIAISIQDNGSGSNQYLNPRTYEFDSNTAALLTITYTTATTTSTTSTSSSTSTTSTSTSTTTTLTSTSTTITTTSTTTLPPIYYPGVFRISKPQINVLNTNNPKNLQFDSKYSTLKYFIKKTCNVTIDISNLDTTGSTTIQHNLGYYPYIEVYLINTENNYEYSPGLHTGASTSWKYTYRITKTTIQVYVETSGFSAPPNTITFYFTVFIFKNNLGL